MIVQKSFPRGSERDHCDIAQRRAQWVKYQGWIDPPCLIFIDRSQGPRHRWRVVSPKNGAKTNIAALRGWAPCGERRIGKTPLHRGQTSTFIAALRHDHIEAPWLLAGPINGECFRLYIEKVLVPTLKPRDIVFMDNLGSHTSKAVRRAVRADGTTLMFLLKYSPDLDPIEQSFAKLKHRLRHAVERTHDALCRAIAEILDTISPTECANHLVNSGHARP